MFIGNVYLGCWKDDANSDLENGPMSYGYDQDSCAEACAGYKYFALQNSGYCICGDAYGTEPQYTQVDDSECNNGVGGGWRNAVYAIVSDSGNCRGNINILSSNTRILDAAYWLDKCNTFLTNIGEDPATVDNYGKKKCFFF